jgi:ABC-type spermidine/putrescine transport system permease subunit II
MITRAALALLLALLLYLTAYPLAMLVYGSLHTTPPGEAGAFNLDGYRAMLSRDNARILLNTIGLSLVKTVSGLAAVDDAGHGPRRWLPVGLRADAGAGAAVRHAVGAARRLRLARQPLAVRTMAGAFSQLAHDLEECSRVHGAAWWTTFRRILLALAWPAFAVGWILIFFIILRELSASILLYSVGNEVLPVVVMRLWTEGKAGQVSVIALVMLALVFLFRFGERKLVRTHLG